jgi:hypothetical protein
MLSGFGVLGYASNLSKNTAVQPSRRKSQQKPQQKPQVSINQFFEIDQMPPRRPATTKGLVRGGVGQCRTFASDTRTCQKWLMVYLG